MAIQGQTMASITHSSDVGETINKRSDTLTKWALNHPKCATNVTSYVGQTARMHCCLARLDRDLSVKFFFFYNHIPMLECALIFAMWYFIANSFRKWNAIFYFVCACSGGKSDKKFNLEVICFFFELSRWTWSHITNSNLFNH